MSRWIRPRRWAYSSARAASRPTCRAWAGSRRWPRVEQAPQRTTTEQLGDQVGHVALAPVVHRHDVRVVEAGGVVRLGPEPLEELGVVGQRVVQHLDRDATAEHDVVGEVHGGGRPGADGGQQPVTATEHLTDTVDHAGDGHSPHATSCTGGIRVPLGGRRPPPARLPQHAPGGHTVGVSDAQTPPPAAPTARPRRKLQPHHAVFALLIVVVVVCVVVLFKKAQSGSTGLDNAGHRPADPGPQRQDPRPGHRRHRPGRRLHRHPHAQRHRRSPTTSSTSSRSSTR